MIFTLKSRMTRGPVPAGKGRSGFTLVETLVVLAIIGVLASLLLPSLARGKEAAKVARVRAELYGIGLALTMYAADNAGEIPPVRVNCNTSLRSDWCELPVELAKEDYLPHGPPGQDADLQDVFNPGHTYKYAAPGPQLLNGSPTANYALWGANQSGDHVRRGPVFHRSETKPDSLGGVEFGAEAGQPESAGHVCPVKPGKLVHASRRHGRHSPLRQFTRDPVFDSLKGKTCEVSRLYWRSWRCWFAAGAGARMPARRGSR